MRSHMPTINYIQPFFNIKGKFIANSYKIDSSLVYKVIPPATEHTCPHYGHATKYIKFTKRSLQIQVIFAAYIFVLNTNSLDSMALNVLRYFQQTSFLDQDVSS